MSHEDDIQWARHVWTIKEFPVDIRKLLLGLGVGQPLLLQHINGDKMYIRRINSYGFQCGIASSPGGGMTTVRSIANTPGATQNYSGGNRPPL